MGRQGHGTEPSGLAWLSWGVVSDAESCSPDDEGDRIAIFKMRTLQPDSFTEDTTDIVKTHVYGEMIVVSALLWLRWLLTSRLPMACCAIEERTKKGDGSLFSVLSSPFMDG